MKIDANPDVVVIEPSDREQALMLASGLAWAVGKLEGMDVETGYAGQVLDRWRYPMRLVEPDRTGGG